MDAMQRRKRLVIFLGLAAAAVAASSLLFPRVRDRIAEEWWIRKLSSEDRDARGEAARRLGELRSARAAPELIRLTGDGRLDRRQAADVLIRIGPPAIDALCPSRMAATGSRGTAHPERAEGHGPSMVSERSWTP